MSKFNKYINNFANNAEYETYINGSVAEVPNTALIDDTGKMIYTKILPNNYVMFGTTTGTNDFMIGQSSKQYSSADCIQVHVVVEDASGINKMYVAQEDVLKTTKYFYSNYNGFGSTEGKKIVSISKWKIDTSNVNNTYEMFKGCTKLTNLDLSGFISSNLTDMGFMFQNCSNLKKLYLSSGFFNSTLVTAYDFSTLSNWKDTETLEMFVEAITAHNGTGKRVKLSTNTKNTLTTEQKTAITNAGWTIA